MVTDQSVVSEFLRLEPGADGLFRNVHGVTAQPWAHTAPFTIRKESGSEKKVVAPYFERGIDPPTANFLICIHEGKVIGVCSAEDFRTRFVKSGDRWILPYLMPSYAAYIAWHGCDVCGSPLASVGLNWSVKNDIFGQLYCEDHSPSISKAKQ